VTANNGRTWVEAHGIPPRFYGMIGVGVALPVFVLFEMAHILGPGGFVHAVEFSPTGNYWPFTILVYVGTASLALPTLLTILWIAPLRIGTSPEGVCVVTRLRLLNVPWESLRPHIAPPKGEWGVLVAGYSELRGPRIVWLTKEQARAVLTDPRAPANLFPQEYWRWVEAPPPLSNVRA
jgi:hypothetical protein